MKKLKVSGEIKETYKVNGYDFNIESRSKKIDGHIITYCPGKIPKIKFTTDIIDKRNVKVYVISDFGLILCDDYNIR